MNSNEQRPLSKEQVQEAKSWSKGGIRSSIALFGISVVLEGIGYGEHNINLEQAGIFTIVMGSYILVETMKSRKKLKRDQNRYTPNNLDIYR